ncbi:MAG TPA: Ig-like domain-containing protein [Acidimicrobiales bacterium]|nr:Ig-like domain-containing protein [Acidimicrobiales bacterium]
MLLVVRAVVGAVLWVALVVPAPAHAQAGRCPSTGVSAASVDVTSPRPGEQVRGVVAVRGRVSAVLTVSRVELLVGRSMVDSQTFSATSNADFDLAWDATRAAPGQASIRVVACGQGVGGVLVHGSETVTVEVAGPLPPTTPAPPPPPGTSTTIRGATTSSTPGSTSSSTSSSSTTSTTGPTTTSTTLPGVETTQPPSDLAAQAAGPPARLLPARAEEGERRSRPLWVGLVVGISGLAGLVLSRTLPGRLGRLGRRGGA